jgi:CDGSH-type Zn-finger protein
MTNTPTETLEVEGCLVEGGEALCARRYPRGPILVRDATTVTDAEGGVHRVQRPVVAICRCGRSRLAPWCDGVHRFVDEAEGVELRR